MDGQTVPTPGRYRGPGAADELIKREAIAASAGMSIAAVKGWLLREKIRNVRMGYYVRTEIEAALARREARKRTKRTKPGRRASTSAAPWARTKPHERAARMPEPTWNDMVPETVAAERIGMAWFDFRCAVERGEIPKPDQVGGKGWGEAQRLYLPETVAAIRGAR